MSQSSERLRDGQTFGRYQILRMLGEGGMGAVYAAVHTGLKKRFAIKTLLPSIAKNAEAQARFLREGEAASRINHPNVVDVTDVGTENGLPYLVMEYLEGETLGDLIGRKGPLGVELTMDLFVPILSAVSAGHDRGVIHRDLKPHNVFLARGLWGDQTPKVLDFGVSKIIGGENPALTGTMSVLGTASYMSPEQARGAKVVDASTDQYALGLIGYEMLTGTRGHAGDSPLEILHRIATGTVPSARDIRPELPPELDQALMRMLAPKPQDRHPSLRAVAKALLPFASDRIRLSYQEAFEDAHAAPRLTGAMVLPVPQAGETMMMPDKSGDAPASAPPLRQGGVGETRVFPQRVDTTLGQGAAEAAAAPAEVRRGKGRVAIALAAVVALVFVAARFATGSRSPAAPPAVSAKATTSAETAPTPPHPSPTPLPIALPPNPTPEQPKTVNAPPNPSTPAKNESDSTVQGAQQHADEHESPKHHVHRARGETRPGQSTPPANSSGRTLHGANNSPILD